MQTPYKEQKASNIVHLYFLLGHNELFFNYLFR